MLISLDPPLYKCCWSDISGETVHHRLSHETSYSTGGYSPMDDFQEKRPALWRLFKGNGHGIANRWVRFLVEQCIVLVVFGVLLGLLLAFKVQVFAITSGNVFLFWLGLLLIYAGMALRFYAIAVLGAFFTTTVAIAPEQPVIEAGPYRIIRHPSYTGFLITLLGLGLSLTNWLSMLVIMGCALLGVSYRIHVEEHVLKAQLGQRYQEYMRRTKRLIPFVL